MTRAAAPASLRVAVAMTTYRAERFLPKQLGTLLEQRRLPDALVVADDASGDGTLALVADFAARAPFPVEVIAHEAGVGVQRNVASALRRAAELGDVVVFADHDDFWEPAKLATLAAAFESDPGATVWFSDATLVGADDRPLGRRLWEFVHLGPEWRAELAAGGGLERLVRGETVTGATMAIRSTLADAVLPVPEARDEDGELRFYWDGWSAVLGRLLGGVVAEPEPLTDYRRHPDQLTAAADAAPGDAPRTGHDARRRALAQHRDQVRLVADRVRERPGLAWDPALRDELFALDAFLAARAAPRGAPARIRRILANARAGSYARYASGARTVLLDLLRPPSGSPGAGPDSLGG